MRAEKELQEKQGDWSSEAGATVIWGDLGQRITVQLIGMEKSRER